MVGSKYNDELSHFSENRYDIMKIYTVQSDSYKGGLLCSDTLNLNAKVLLWERQEPKKLTKAEIEKLLGYEIEIVG